MVFTTFFSLFIVWFAHGSSVKSCNIYAAIIDNYELPSADLVQAATHLISPKCTEFIMGRDDLDPKDMLRNAKSRILHYVDRLVEKFLRHSDEEDPQLRSLGMGVVSAMLTMVEAQDKAAMSQVFGLQRLAELLASFFAGKPGDKGKTPIQELLEKNERLDISKHEGLDPGIDPPDLVIFNFSQGITDLHQDNGPKCDVPEGKLSEGIVGLKGESEKIINEIEEDDRQLDEKLPKSKDSVAMKIGGKTINVPCSQIVTNDFTSQRLKSRDLSSDCFNDIPENTKKLAFVSAASVADLREEIWEDMNSSTLIHFLENDLLNKVGSSKLSRIGKQDPTVCEAFNDPEELEKIKNLKTLDPKCIAMAPAWGKLAEIIGSGGPNNILSYLSGEQLDPEDDYFGNNIGDLANAKLSTAQLQSIGAEGMGFCEKLKVDLVKQIKNWGDNLDPKCLKINPSLIAAVSESRRSKYLNDILNSGSAVTSFDDEVFVIITEIASVNLLKRMFEVGNHCETLSRTISRIPKAKLPVTLEYCPDADLKRATDEQVAQIIQKNCEKIDIPQTLLIGIDRLFKEVKSSCLKQLPNDVISTLNNSSIVYEVIGRLDKQQLAELTGDTVASNLSYLNAGQFSMLAGHHIEAIRQNEEAFSYYQQKIGAAKAA